MIKIKEIKECEFWIHICDVEVFDEDVGIKVKKKVDKILTSNNNITIDLDNIRMINSKGYAVLMKIMQEAYNKLANIYFTNVHEDIDELIRTLTLTSES